jgi:hypothetical protein
LTCSVHRLLPPTSDETLCMPTVVGPELTPSDQQHLRGRRGQPGPQPSKIGDDRPRGELDLAGRRAQPVLETRFERAEVDAVRVLLQLRQGKTVRGELQQGVQDPLRRRRPRSWRAARLTSMPCTGEPGICVAPVSNWLMNISSTPDGSAAAPAPAAINVNRARISASVRWSGSSGRAAGE